MRMLNRLTPRKLEEPISFTTFSLGNRKVLNRWFTLEYGMDGNQIKAVPLLMSVHL